MWPALCAPSADIGSANPSLISAQGLEARIAQTESSADLDTDVKAKILARYREALGNLKEADVNRERAAAFEDRTRTAPEETRRVRERISATGMADDMQPLDVDLRTARGQIELRLRKAQADLAAAEARQADFERQRSFHERRPTMIRQRLTAAQEQQEEIAATLGVGAGADERSAPTSARIPALMQAGWAGMETRYFALSTEIQALEQELLSLPMRLDLLAAKRDEEADAVGRLRGLVDRLKALLNDKYEIEAAQAKADAARMLSATAGSDPVLVGLARRNAELTDQLSNVVGKLDDHDEDESEAIRSAERIKGAFERVQAARELSGFSDGIGALLLQHRSELPHFDIYARRARAQVQQIAAVNGSRVRHLDEATRIADLDRAVSELALELSPDHRPHDLDMLRNLLAERQALLAKQLEAEGAHLDALRSLKSAEGRMLEEARAYKNFIEEHLFWLGTEPGKRLADFAKLGPEAGRLASPPMWSELRRSLAEQMATSRLYWLTLAVAAVLLWKRRALIEAIERTSARADRPESADSPRTLRALMLTLVLAAPVPLLLGVTGWLLRQAPSGTEVSQGMGFHLVVIAVYLYVLLVLRAICLPSGLAIEHFRWPQPEVQRLRSESGWLIWILTPAMFVAVTALSANPEALGGLVHRLASLFVNGGIALFFFRLFHPKSGVLSTVRQGADSGLFYRAYPLWYPMLVALPLLIQILAWQGYIYAAHVLFDAYMLTLGSILVLVLMHALAWSWLTRARRRLARQVARERRQVALAQRESLSDEELVALPSNYADIDLSAANRASRELLGLGTTLLALGALYAIWSPVFPALGVFDEVTLWHTTGSVDGEETALPVTLADLGLALLYMVAIVALVARLPSMLDVILAERLRMSSSSRYTLMTLTTYVIVAVGLVLALNRLGAQWSQLQWLVAALGVGIGFGLQEIVANFVSGVIILFERPVRVGDVVSIGGTDGVVTKIRIRATTIRGYDRKELLVPNKELITGRLLNWSLSDSVTRIMIAVGVAYDTDVDKAHALMQEAAAENPRVLATPKPSINFEGFGDNALTLTLRAYIDDIEQRLAINSELHKAINRKFREAGIVIAYPQRDLHLSTDGPLRVILDDSGQANPGDASSIQPK
jgi:potassium-dependent mechanosensitive channel